MCQEKSKLDYYMLKLNISYSALLAIAAYKLISFIL